MHYFTTILTIMTIFFFERTNYTEEQASLLLTHPQNANNLEYLNVLLCKNWICTQLQTKGLVIAIYQKLEKNKPSSICTSRLDRL